MKKISSLLLIITSIMFFSYNTVKAGPTIIRDSRIRDTAITPVLGRGYSLGTNTFQSTCMDEVVITEPSYDFEYSFVSREKSKNTSKSSSKTKNTNYSKDNNSSGTSSRSSNNRKTSSQYKKAYKRIYARADKVTKSGTKSTYSHVIEVNIKVTTYYASVDEAKSTLSESAALLLTNKDIPGFFNSCGPYYVRSIGREATFLSFFEYKTETKTRDKSFERQIEDQIRAFNSGSGNSDSSSTRTTRTKTRPSKWWRRDKYKTTTDTTKRKSTFDTNSETNIGTKANDANSFSENATSKQLTITSFAFGLGKTQGTKLIAYDLKTFKAAIKDAFISMMNARTGKVVNMEVVPWVENTGFQSLIELEKSSVEEYEDVLNAAGKPVLDKDGKPTKRLVPQPLLYEKKMLLNENAEFIIEIDRADRNIMNMYYKAKLCRRNIDMNWKNDDSFKEGYEEALVQNNKNMDGTISLKELDQIVSMDVVNNIYNTHLLFMYGDVKKKDGGASACMREIMKKGIFKVSYRDIKACQPIIKNMGEIQNDKIDQYCLPELED